MTMQPSLRVTTAFFRFLEQIFENGSVEKNLKELDFTREGLRLTWERGTDYGTLAVDHSGDLHIFYTIDGTGEFEMIGERLAPIIKEKLAILIKHFCKD